MQMISNSEYLVQLNFFFFWKVGNTLNIFDVHTNEVAIITVCSIIRIICYLYKSFKNFFTVNRENHYFNTRNRDDFEIR